MATHLVARLRDVRPISPQSRARAQIGAGRGVGHVLLRLLYRVEVVGADRVPTSGPLVLVANHVGFLDGPVAFVTSPRPAHFLVKRAYFRGPMGALLRGVGQIPITQRSADRTALTAARGILVDGGVVGVFPEGTRGDGSVNVAQQGAAFLALGAKALVVPVALAGTAGRSRGAWPRLRSTIRVTFGEPFDLAGHPKVAGARGRARLVIATEQLRLRLAEHVGRTSAF